MKDRIQLNLQETARARHYEGSIEGRELFDLFDDIDDSLDVNPGRQLKTGEYENLVNSKVVKPKCEEFANDGKTLTKVKYMSQSGKLETHCVVFE